MNPMLWSTHHRPNCFCAFEMSLFLSVVPSRHDHAIGLQDQPIIPAIVSLGYGIPSKCCPFGPHPATMQQTCLDLNAVKYSHRMYLAQHLWQCVPKT